MAMLVMVLPVPRLHLHKERGSAAAYRGMDITSLNAEQPESEPERGSLVGIRLRLNRHVCFEIRHSEYLLLFFFLAVRIKVMSRMPLLINTSRFALIEIM